MVSFSSLRPFGPLRRKCSAQAIEKGNAEGARIYAQNAIREKNSGLNYLRMSARIDAVAQRLDTVVKNQAMQKSIVKVNKGLSSALKSMNVEKISKEMDAFERQFEDIDVRAKYMEDAMGNTTASATPEDQVDALISQVADEHQLDVSFALDDAGQVGNTAPAQAEESPCRSSVLVARHLAVLPAERHSLLLNPRELKAG